MDEVPAPVVADPQQTPIRAEPTHSSRIGMVWVTLTVFVVILIALLIFVSQNSMAVEIHYLGLKTRIGFGVAMLLSAAAGIVLTILIGSARILQLKLLRRNEKL